MIKALEEADPRLKILLALALGILTWRCGPAGLLLFLAAVSLMSWRLLGRGEQSWRTLRGLLGLILIWSLLKAFFEWIDGAGWEEIGLETAVLGGRLLTLILLGLCLTAVTSLAQLGRGVSSFLRLLPGGAGWRAALGLSLMVHFLPLCLRTIRQAHLGLALRAEGLPLRTRLVLFVQTVLRVLTARTWEQTLALASRGLDRPEAWQGEIPFSPLQWLTGFCVFACAFVVSLL